MTMKTSELTWALANSIPLSQRVAAIVRTKWWNDGVGRTPPQLDMTQLVWSIATNATVLATVAANLGDPESVDAGQEAVPDGDLEYILFNTTNGSYDRLYG